jgi:hypothetical protein
MEGIEKLPSDIYKEIMSDKNYESPVHLHYFWFGTYKKFQALGYIAQRVPPKQTSVS